MSGMNDPDSDEMRLAALLKEQSKSQHKLSANVDKLLTGLSSQGVKLAEKLINELLTHIRANGQTLDKAISLVQATYETSQTVRSMEEKLAEQRNAHSEVVQRMELQCSTADTAVAEGRKRAEAAVNQMNGAVADKIAAEGERDIARSARDQAVQSKDAANEARDQALRQAVDAHNERDEALKQAQDALTQKNDALQQVASAHSDRDQQIQIANEAREQAISAKDTALEGTALAEEAKESLSMELTRERQEKNAALSSTKRAVEESLDQQRASAVDLQEAYLEMETLDLVAAKAQADLKSEYSEAKEAWERKTKAVEDECESLVGQNTELLKDILERRKVFREMQDSLQKLENGINAWKQQEQAAAYAHYFAKYVAKVDEFRGMFMSSVRDHVNAGGCPNCPGLRTQLEDCSSFLTHFREAYGTEAERNEELADLQGVMVFEYNELDAVFNAVADEAAAGKMKYRKLHDKYRELESVCRIIADKNEVLQANLQDQYSDTEELEIAYRDNLEELEDVYADKVAEIEQAIVMTVLWQTRGAFRNIASRNNAAIIELRQELSQVKGQIDSCDTEYKALSVSYGETTSDLSRLKDHRHRIMDQIDQQWDTVQSQLGRLAHEDDEQVQPASDGYPMDDGTGAQVEESASETLDRKRGHSPNDEGPSGKKTRNEDQSDSVPDAEDGAVIESVQTGGPSDADANRTVVPESGISFDDAADQEPAENVFENVQQSSQNLYHDVKELFFLAFDYTLQQKADFFEQLERHLRGRDQSVDEFRNWVDAYCQWPEKPDRQKVPCFFAKIHKKSGGTGLKMTEKSCAWCSKQNPAKTCFFVKLCILNLDGRDIRWVVKRRKQSAGEPADPIWAVEGHEL